jgi:arsenite-transporting ATPase
MTDDRRPSFLTADADWILFGGKGGVGKTTSAAATALARAERGETVRLLSTDPAHSLRDSLAAAEAPGRLAVQEFDAGAALDAFRDEHSDTLHEIVSRGTLFDDEDIGRLLDLGLPGMDEVMAFLRLARHLDAPDVDTLVVDTAPTGHTLRLLDTPEVFEAWLGVLDVMLEKHRTLKAAFARTQGPDALDGFLDEMERRAARVQAALRDPDQCRFVGVTQAEALVLAETDRLIEDLEQRGLPVHEWVVNRLPWNEAGPARSSSALRRLRRHRDRFDGYTLWGLPAYEAEVRGVGRLRRLWADAVPLPLDDEPDAGTAAAARAARGGPAVRRSLPSPAARLLLFAGKGGVGKTTMACATALHRADRRAEQVLLLSTDPAHSLAAALDVPLDDTPRTVAPGLDAVEVDAPARFAALRDDYVDEVRRFFRQSTGEQIDLTYDRPVMERLLDLAPPGVDEMMGWTAAMDGLDADRYDACVLDTAPTGHFVRLLEMPRLFEEWLQAFFHILQKYKQVFRLPRLSDRLVRLSKQTKRVRRLLEEEGGAVYGVTLPTEMAWAETRDLVEHADRLEVTLPALILNRAPAAPDADEAPPAGDGDGIGRRFAERFPGREYAVVTDGRPPEGVQALQRLGNRLYAN